MNELYCLLFEIWLALPRFIQKNVNRNLDSVPSLIQFLIHECRNSSTDGFYSLITINTATLGPKRRKKNNHRKTLLAPLATVM